MCSQVQIVPLSEELAEQVIIYDKGISGRNRELFLREYFATASVTTCVAIAHDVVVGYSCRVPMMDGTMRLAPLFADSFEIAVALLNQVCDFSGKLHGKLELNFRNFSVLNNFRRLLLCSLYFVALQVPLRTKF